VDATIFFLGSLILFPDHLIHHIITGVLALVPLKMRIGEIIIFSNPMRKFM